MFCVNCGQPMADTAKFCGHCGAPAWREGQAGAAQAAPGAPTPEGTPAGHEVAAAGVAPSGVAPEQAAAPAPQAAAASDAAPDDAQPKRRRALIGGGVAVAVVAVIVAILFATGVLAPGTAVNAENFPNPRLRAAVEAQLDANGDGKLSAEEAAQVTGLIYTDKGTGFLMDGADPWGIDEGDLIVSDASQFEDEAEALAVLDGLGAFPNLTTLLAYNASFTSVDLSQAPALETVDLRGADITELDLSANAHIAGLSCGSDVSLIGLDEAGLYHTKLLSSVIVEGSRPTTMWLVAYDAQGRPHELKSHNAKQSDTEFKTAKTYSYDDAGRLIEAKKPGEDGWWERYSYDDAGNLTEMTYFQPLDAGAKPFTWAYRYDDSGLLTGATLKYPSGSVSMDGQMSYDSEHPIRWSAGGATSSFAWKGGVLTSVAASGSGTPSSTALTYADGALIGYEYKENGVALRTVGTTYDENGFPKKTTSRVGYSSSHRTTYETTYETDNEGYVTKASWVTGSDTPMSGCTADLSYFTFVGSLDDRASRRYVPVIELGSSYTARVAGDLVEYVANQDLYTTTGNENPISLLERSPQQAYGYGTGLLSSVVTNPNEVALARYDREQWAAEHGLEVAPGEDAGAAQAESAATPQQALLDDPVYGSVVSRAAQLARAVASHEYGDFGAMLSDYKDLPTGLVEYIQSDGSGEVLACLMDLNGDGTDELLISTPSLYGAMDDPEFAACYTAVDGKARPVAEAMARDHWWLAEGGILVESGSGGASTGFWEASALDGTSLKLVARLAWDQDGPSTTTLRVTQQKEGASESVSQMSSAQLDEAQADFKRAYPGADISWVTIGA